MRTIDQLIKALEMELEDNITGMAFWLNEAGGTWNMHFDGQGNVRNIKLVYATDYTSDASGCCGRIWND